MNIALDTEIRDNLVFWVFGNRRVLIRGTGSAAMYTWVHLDPSACGTVVVWRGFYPVGHAVETECVTAIEDVCFFLAFFGFVVAAADRARVKDFFS